MKHLNIIKSATISEIVKQALSVPAPAEIPGGTGDQNLDNILEQAAQPSQRYINRISTAGKRPQYEAQHGPITGTTPGYAETPYNAETSGVGGIFNNIGQMYNNALESGANSYSKATNYLGSLLPGSAADNRMDAQNNAAEQASPAYTRAMQAKTNQRAFADKVRKDYGANPTIPKATPVSPQPPAQVGPPAPAPAGKAPTMPASRPATPAKPAPDFNAIFRKQHGSAFDPKSRVDKQKMQQLQAGYKG
jgi:hypothetical protein